MSAARHHAAAKADLRHVETADGVRIAVHDLGGSGRPAILAHANGFHGHVFSSLARELAPKVHSLALDLRGHGRSSAREDLDFSWDGFAEDILAACSLVVPFAPHEGGGAAPIGIGHSLGGAALLLAEARRPGSFAGLYCYEPILVSRAERRPPATENALARGARIRRDHFADVDEAMAHYRERPFFQRVAPEVLEDYVRHGFTAAANGSIQLRCRPEHEARTFEAAWASDVTDHLASVRCPVMVAVGGLSRDIGRRAAATALSALPHAASAEFPDLGHLGPLEDPGAVAASIDEFIASLET